MAKKLSLNFFTWNGVGIPTIPLGSAWNTWGRVKYCGYPISEASWEPEHMFSEDRDLSTCYK